MILALLISSIIFFCIFGLITFICAAIDKKTNKINMIKMLDKFFYFLTKLIVTPGFVILTFSILTLLVYKSR
ncbi:hypothetical protein A9P88_07000 [Klebsiella quasipneumoniae subsp. similipneumoniae]|nr:hypothetical protein A9P88_07000 [Klebsiella quasipneumoniae subsp. similipneumoniae]